jgi:internalin A
MSDTDEGLRIARERITGEASARTGFLDLGRLGLNELPAELFTLKHLQTLNLGAVMRPNFVRSVSSMAPNRIDAQISRLSMLPELAELSVAGTSLRTLAGIAELRALKSLDCSETQVEDLSPLAEMSALQSLYCRDTQISDLSPLAQASALKVLHCGATEVSDLSPLAGLSALQSLYCWRTQISDLSPIAGASALEAFTFGGTRVSDLSPLAGLRALRSLNFWGTRVSDLSPLARLDVLRSLGFPVTQVEDLSPLAGLNALQSLDCSETQVKDLSPLAGLNALQSLDCSETQVEDLSPLAGLNALQSLDCPRTQISDLSPVARLNALQSLNCSGCSFKRTFEDLWQKPCLKRLVLFGTQLPGIPADVLSQSEEADCLESLRAHLTDLGAGAVAVSDIKLMVLGNGRVGKTQICRRLRGEDYDPHVSSTHGVIVTSGPVLGSSATDPTTVHFWDFGGQDIYHGTHVLFMRSRAVILIAWTPEAESSGEHVWDGMKFRNHPMPYWIDTVQHFGVTGSPVLIVQTRCDRLEDEVHRLPAPPELLAGLTHWELQYSAFNNRKRGALDEALREAIDRLRDQEGELKIGIGRLKVKQRLEQLRDADAAVPLEQRQYRTITQQHFRQLCDEAGSISAPQHLLSYLHNAGVVFYRAGLFDDRIILDQAWALEAIYAVFNRESCYRPLRHLRGRFSRAILEALVWREHTVAEQEVFLGMMRSCGICFVHRHKNWRDSDDEEYIAPDLLPERSEIQAELDAVWDAEAPVETTEFEYTLLHPGVVRSVISRIGSEAGVTALYWRGGLCVYETATRSRALIEQEMADDWRGKIVVRTQSGQATGLLRRLSEVVRDESARVGAQPINVPISDRLTQISERSQADDERALSEPTRPFEFSQERSSEPEYFVSYAWGDVTTEGKEREATVDRLCEAAEERGLVILRDKNVLRLGDSIEKLMQRLAGGDRVFVILSDKYLRSPYCMYELLEIWRKCEADEVKFLTRVRVYIVPGTKVYLITHEPQPI